LCDRPEPAVVPVRLVPGDYGAFGAVLRPHSRQNFDPTGITVPHAAQVTVGPAAAGFFGSRRRSTIAMTQIPTTSKIHVMNPMMPKIRTMERNPPNPESRLEKGLLELFELPFPFPFPLLEEVTSIPTLLLED